jgi:hypothetical protein
MKRFLSVLWVTLVIAGGVSAQDSVNNEELEQHQGPVQFVSNTNVPTRIDSRAAIVDIGNSLGKTIRSGANEAGQSSRYFVIHSVSIPKTDTLDADIFGLGPGVGVDHIRNLRLIIQGYLEGAYEYSAKDAALLAQYITIYNAVFRGNMTYFTSRYTSDVLKNLTAEKAGLSNRYNEWPGRTLIVIPLGNAIPGSLSAVDTTPLTEPEVLDELRKEDDKGLDVRKDMVDLKEREAEEAEQRAAEQQPPPVQQPPAPVQTPASTPPPQQAAPPPSRPADSLPPPTQPPPPTTSEEEEEPVADQQEETQTAQERAEQKTAEAQRERQEIAADQQEVIAGGGIPAPVLVIGTAMNSPLSPLGRIVQVNAASGREVKSSSITTVNIRTVYFTSDAIIALAAQSDGSYRLVKFATDTLETTAQGDDVIGANSLLWMNGSNLYAIVSSGPATFSLARFDVNLKLQASSLVAVHPFASVIFRNNLVLSEHSNGDVLFLDPQDLSEQDAAD